MLMNIPKGKKQPLIDAIVKAQAAMSKVSETAREARRPGLASVYMDLYTKFWEDVQMIRNDREEK
jgi:hypothetical protein